VTEFTHDPLSWALCMQSGISGHRHQESGCPYWRLK
jgi:hypothetical protein